jgi:Zn-dependent peptidase ImmA (M78 family)
MQKLTPSEELLQSLGITEPDEIDLEAIAWDQGVEIKYRKLDGCEARILGVGNRAIITIDDQTIERRKRFSIGHELGHWHHHRGKSFACRKEDIGNYAGINATSEAEKVADKYSADLLLPKYIFKNIVKNYSQPTFETIFSIADVFNVSKTSTAIRYVEHGNHPCMLICYSKTGRKWFRRNIDVPSKLFPHDQLDHESEAFEVLFGNKTYSKRVTTAGDAWFNWWKADRYEVCEETVQLIDGETLTLLTWKNEQMLAEAGYD